MRFGPEMLPLIQLDQEAIDRIVATVPDGVKNVWKISHLPAPHFRREFLFEHLAAEQKSFMTVCPFRCVPRLTSPSAFLIQGLQILGRKARHPTNGRRGTDCSSRLSRLSPCGRAGPNVSETASSSVTSSVNCSMRGLQMRRGFDVMRAPLVRVIVLRSPQGCSLFFAISHLIEDFTFLEMILEFLHAHVRGVAARPMSSLQFSDLCRPYAAATSCRESPSGASIWPGLRSPRCPLASSMGNPRA